MRCLVSGVAGFIGSSIAERLLKEGHSVVGLDCFLPYYAKDIKEKNLRNLEGFSSFSFVESNLLECDLNVLCEGVEWIFHEAAQAGVRASWGGEFETYTSNNVLATQRLLEALRGSSSLKKIIYASSSSVYGNAESYPTKETTLPKPISPYGVSKLAAEHLMRLYASEFEVPTVSLRYFTVFGPRQRPDMAFNRFISAALQGNEIVVYGDGEQMRDFTFIGDVVDANLLAAERGRPGSVMNIGGGTNATVLEVLDIISSLIGPLKIKKIECQAGDARRTSADTTLARQEIGFAPKVGLEEGLSREVAWLREQFEK